MDIKTDIETFLETSGWTVTQLAHAAGLSIPTVSRLKTGARKGTNLLTYNKLKPILYPSEPQQRAAGE